MAKRQAVPLCSRCDAPFRSQTAFCAECGGPSPWATHDDRVAWEVRQWRASRAREGEHATPMMLVRTDEGFQPAPMDPRTQYVWDQPLHPEREEQHAPATGRGNGNGSNGNRTGVEAKPIPYAGVTTPAPPPQTAPVLEPAPEAGPALVPGPLPSPRQMPAPTPVSQPAPAAVAAPPSADTVEAHEDQVSVSKKAVAVAIALVLGLPLGGKALNLVGSEPEASRRPAAAKAGAPVAIAAARSGFLQVSGDAVRYAVLIRNPNRSHAARNVSVSVSLFDAKGRLIGSDVERLPVVFAGTTGAVAGTTGVDGRVARLAVRLSSDGFVEAAGRPFAVRSVRLSRNGPDLVVRAALSGAKSMKGARVVAVHFDAHGAIVGGDVAYVDIPQSPRSVGAVITTSGAAALVHRVQLYVLAPR